MFAWDLSGRQSSSFVLWHRAESLTLPPSPSAEPTAGGRGTGRGREFSLAGPAVSHLGSHPAKCLKQPDNSLPQGFALSAALPAEPAVTCGFCGRAGRGGGEVGGRDVRLAEAQLGSTRA